MQGQGPMGTQDQGTQPSAQHPGDTQPNHIHIYNYPRWDTQGAKGPLGPGRQRTLALGSQGTQGLWIPGEPGGWGTFRGRKGPAVWEAQGAQGRL